MSNHPKLDEAIKRGEIQQCPHCQAYWVSSLHQHECVGMVRARLVEVEKQRDALADALWSAEDQWGDDYLWEKWGLSKHLTKELKDELTSKAKK